MISGSILREVFREAWTALRRSPTRSIFTMLGIVWGIAAVTLLVAYGNGFRGVLVAPSMLSARALSSPGLHRPVIRLAVSAPGRSSVLKRRTWRR